MYEVPLKVIKYAAQECEWQESGEMSVFWMIQGWQYALTNYAMHREQEISLDDIVQLGKLIEPKKNRTGLRRSGVQVGSDTKLSPDEIFGALTRLIEVTPPLSSITEEEATQWFRQYEDIHPFRDGNGRTGSLLYNWLRGTLVRPDHVPNLWHDPQREMDQGSWVELGPDDDLSG